MVYSALNDLRYAHTFSSFSGAQGTTTQSCPVGGSRAITIDNADGSLSVGDTATSVTTNCKEIADGESSTVNLTLRNVVSVANLTSPTQNSMFLVTSAVTGSIDSEFTLNGVRYTSVASAPMNLFYSTQLTYSLVDQSRLLTNINIQGGGSRQFIFNGSAVAETRQSNLTCHYTDLSVMTCSQIAVTFVGKTPAFDYSVSMSALSPIVVGWGTGEASAGQVKVEQDGQVATVKYAKSPTTLQLVAEVQNAAGITATYSYAELEAWLYKNGM